MSRGGRILSALLPLAFAACEGGGDPGPGAAASVSVDTAASGIVHVAVRGESPRWRLQEMLTVGSPGEGGASAGDRFGDVASVALDRSGALWVADRETGEIRVFGPEGHLIRLIGRPGGAAGEFEVLQSMTFLGNEVLALDLGRGRIVELSPSGAPLGERPAPAGLTGSPERVRFYPVGPAEVYQWSVRSTDTGVDTVWVRHGPQGVQGVRPQAVPSSPAPPAEIVCESPSGGVRSFEIPFVPRWVQHPAAGGRLAVAWTGRYRVAFLNAADDTVRVLERDRSPGTVSQEDWDSATSRYRTFREENPEVRCDADLPERPASRPVLWDVLVDTSGRTWVGARTTEGRVWDIYDATGHPLGTLPAFETGGGAAPWLAADHVAWVRGESPAGERVTVARILR